MEEYLWKHIQIFLDRDDLHSSTQDAMGTDKAGLLSCRHWSTFYTDQVGNGTSCDYVSRCGPVGPFS